eukprot:scaffold10559_cov74-Skeletonema_dohrnii-CCMP3373.AAC.1
MLKQKQKSKDKRQSEANADGCILPLNLLDELMSRAATKCWNAESSVDPIDLFCYPNGQGAY